MLQLQHFFGIIKCVEKYTHIVSIKRVLVYTIFFMWLKQYGGKTKRRKEKMAVVAMKQLLEAGVHFGHQTRRWDPKMAEYIFQARNGIHIIDLQKTSKKLDEAYAFLKEQAEAGKTVLFVGTKNKHKNVLKKLQKNAVCTM